MITRDPRAAETLPMAGLLRRLGALVYDTLLLLAVLMVATVALLPFTGGEAITFDRVGALEYAYRMVLAVVIVAFFGFFWIYRGQTLGMAAWRLRIERMDGARLGWADVMKRLAAACISLVPAGLGIWWILVDRDGLAWHDRLSYTRIVVTPRKGRR